MAKFLQGSALNAALERIIEEAQESLMLISPYIKLHTRVKDQLKLKLDNPRLKIIIVYGKKGKLNKLIEDDLSFLKKLPNIEIRYEKNLHAKYYANENEGLITSMNLYDFSQNNNIEAGVLAKPPNIVTALVKNDDDVDREAYQYFLNVIKNSELLYHNEPVKLKALLGLQTKYSESIVQLDIVDSYHVGAINTSKSKIDQNSEVFNEKQQMGFCIRTGEKTPFNIEKPYNEKAFNSWSKWRNEKYAEKYCHFSGELSNGETCFASPILRKNWKDAKSTFNF